MQLLRRALRELKMVFAYKRDPIGFHRSRGARIGENVELINGHIHSFGSEPYLVSVGNNVTISSGVEIITHDGGLRVVRDEHPDACIFRPIVIGDNVFIGARSIIMPGVTIGSRSVVGAGSIVTRDVPPGMVVAGAPARPLKTVEEYVAGHRERWIDTSGLDDGQKRELLTRRLAAEIEARERLVADGFERQTTR